MCMHVGARAYVDMPNIYMYDAYLASAASAEAHAHANDAFFEFITRPPPPNTHTQAHT